MGWLLPSQVPMGGLVQLPQIDNHRPGHPSTPTDAEAVALTRWGFKTHAGPPRRVWWLVEGRGHTFPGFQ